MSKLMTILLALPIWCNAQKELEGNCINAIANGGLPPYAYSLDGINYQSNDTFKCLIPSTYILRIKDNRDSVATQSIKLYSPLTLILSATRSMITATASDGKPQYLYSKNSTTNWQTSNLFSNLSRRTTYTIRVKDALGYVVEQTIRTL